MKKELSSQQQEDLFGILKTRFEKNMNRHEGIAWDKIQKKLDVNPEKLWSLNEMEKTGGEPDVVGFDKKTDEYIFYDCTAESPRDRRSICYDRAALDARKANKPRSSVMDEAAAMGVEVLNEEEYRHLQTLGEFDLKTSSWIKTTPEVRKLGGALFCDRRFGRVFTFHNTADCYYGSRGFRSSLKI